MAMILMKYAEDKVFGLFAIAFILVNATSFTTLFVNLSCGLILALYALFFLKRTYSLSPSKHSHSIQLFNLYLFFELFSIPLSFLSPYGSFVIDHPLIFLYGFSYLLIPQLFFFRIGVGIKSTKQAVLFLLKCNAFLVFVSIVLYVVRPNCYIDLISRKLPDVFGYYGGFVPRLVGYIVDSMAMGVICSSSFVLSLAFVDKWKFFYLLLFLVGSIMSMQRSSWVALLVASMIYLMLSKRLFNLSMKWFMLIGILFFAVVYFITHIEVEGGISYMELLSRRYEDMGEAVSSRDNQWYSVLDAIVRYPIGFGLGSLSHKGVNMGFPLTCPDGNYFRILGDTGLLGFLSFLVLNISTIRYTFRRKHFGLLCALLVFLAQAIGTNVFDLYYASFIYWFLMGLSSKKIIYGKE